MDLFMNPKKLLIYLLEIRYGSLSLLFISLFPFLNELNKVKKKPSVILCLHLDYTLFGLVVLDTDSYQYMSPLQRTNISLFGL
jgi:hypothetical protein